MKEALRKSRNHDRIEVNQLGAVRTGDFLAELLEYKPRIVHFSGHGKSASLALGTQGVQLPENTDFTSLEFLEARTRATSKKKSKDRKLSNSQAGGLVFEDENGLGKVIPADEVASFFERRENSVECVVLNSCFSEETAKKINKHVRYVIGMNQEIPDDDAIRFSKYFYLSLGAGNTIESAFKEARKHLSDPLMAIFESNDDIRPQPYYEPRWILLSSAASALFIIFLRLLGGFQGLEIAFFDHLQTSWSWPRDDRILIVQATHGDVRDQQRRGEAVIGSFSNQTLGNLLEKINELKPAAIGLDIYREDLLNDAAQADNKLKTLLGQENIFGICKLPQVEEGGVNQSDRTLTLAVPPSPYIEKSRIGFSDILADSDTVVRRHILGGFGERVGSEDDCIAPKAFNLLLANHYLEAQNRSAIALKHPPGQLCRVEFPNGQVSPSLQPYTGGYQGDENIGGECQVLLKYRINHDSWKSAEMVTVQQVLDGVLANSDLRGKIVLIGVTRTDGYRDYWNTPYNRLTGQTMPGVMLHAQKISQLLDAALDQKPLIWVLPVWGEWLWILFWSSLGGIIIWRFQLLPLRIGVLLLTIGTGYLICYVIFQVFLGWLPFIPIVLVLAAAPLSNWLVDSGRLRIYKLRKYR